MPGESSTLTYNAAGADADRHEFHPGRLDGGDGGAVSTIVYDSYGRPWTITASDSYSVTLDYEMFGTNTFSWNARNLATSR